MKRLHHLMLAAILTICSASVFTACTFVNDDNAVVVVDDKPFDRDQYIDASVRLGDDFYRYALGQWLDDNLPGLDELANPVLIGFRDRAILDSSDPVMTAIRQLEAEAEVDCSADMQLLQSRIDMLSAITTQAELEAAFAQLHQLGYAPLLRQIGIPNGGVFSPVLVAAKVSRANNQSMANHNLTWLYEDVPMVCNLLNIMGFSDQRIDEICQHALVIEQLEMEIYDVNFDQFMCRKPMPPSRTRGTEPTPMSRYSQLIGLGDVADKVDCFSYNKQVIDQLIDMLFAGTDESIALMRDYLIYFVMAHDSSFIPQVSPQLWYYWRLYDAVRCHPYHLYRLETEVEGKDDIQKQKCSEMMEEMRQLLIERIDQLDWMSDATKQEAKKKARAMTFRIGYPDEWNEEFVPKIEGTTLLEAVSGLRRQAVEMQRKLVGRDARTHGWDYWCSTCIFPAHTSFYIRLGNQLFIAPKHLLPPFFDTQQSEAALYATATIFSHEMGHGFDYNGSYYDENGIWCEWWAADDRAAFKKKVQQMITLWSQLEAYPGQPADGEKTLDENIADLMGVTLAYEAYKRRLKKQGYSGEQFDDQLRKFWLSYAYLYADESERSVDGMIWRYQNDTHSAPHNRINGIARLFDDWYRLFDVKPTDKLYLAPEDRVKIW